MTPRKRRDTQARQHEFDGSRDLIQYVRDWTPIGGSAVEKYAHGDIDIHIHGRFIRAGAGTPEVDDFFCLRLRRGGISHDGLRAGGGDDLHGDIDNAWEVDVDMAVLVDTREFVQKGESIPNGIEQDRVALSTVAWLDSIDKCELLTIEATNLLGALTRVLIRRGEDGELRLKESTPVIPFATARQLKDRVVERAPVVLNAVPQDRANGRREIEMTELKDVLPGIRIAVRNARPHVVLTQSAGGQFEVFQMLVSAVELGPPELTRNVDHGGNLGHDAPRNPRLGSSSSV